MISKIVTRNSLLLALFAAITTAAVAGAFLSTKDAIAVQKRAAEQAALLEIFPEDTHDNSMLDDIIPVSDSQWLSLSGTKSIYVAKKAGEPVGFIFPVVAPEGYTEPMIMIVGVTIEGIIAGARVLQQKETPGLGDNVELRKSEWILGFNGKSLSNPSEDKWKVKKDKGVFDQFAGATITPRAVTKAVYQTLKYYEANKDSLIQAAKTPTARNEAQ